MFLKFTHQGLSINGEIMPVYSGEVHYWRLEKTLWSDILDNVINMGFKIIATYIPWSVHEVKEGIFDFGKIQGNNDLDGFLSLCEEKGLMVFVRPGPHINAELTFFGYPERILYDTDIQAKTPWGTPVIVPHFPKQFPMPGYASEKLYLETEKYFDAIAPILLKHQYPEGCIIALQADNETCYFFKDRAYIADYSSDSIKLYRHMLEEKYKSINELNRIYRAMYDSFDTILPPKGFEGKGKKDLPYYFDWIEYKEYHIIQALRRIADIWKKKGLSIPVYHNSAGHWYTPIDIIRTESTSEIDFEGIDEYYSLDEIRNRVRYVAGSSKLPYCAEFGSGAWYDTVMDISPKETEFCTLYAFMNGMKAVNYYMIVERDRWKGSPVTRDNRIREEYFAFYKKLNKFLMDEGFNRFERRPQALVLRNYDLGRFKALFSIMDIGSMSGGYFPKGFDIPSQLFKPNLDLGFKNIDQDFSHCSLDLWVENIISKLLKENIDFNCSDTHLSLEKLMDYPVVFASACDFMDRTEQERLLEYVKRGGKLILGPGIPYLDREMNECTIIGEYISLTNEEIQDGNGMITASEAPDSLNLERLGLAAKYISDNDNIEISRFCYGSREILFAANISKQDQDAQIKFNGRKGFVSKWESNDINGVDVIKINMKSHSIFVWEVL